MARSRGGREGWPWVLWGLCACAALAGCHPDRREVTRIGVAADTIGPGGWCGLTAQALEAELGRRIAAIPTLRLVPGRKVRPEEIHYELMLLPVPLEDSPHKVMAGVVIRRLKGEEGARYQVGASAARPPHADAATLRAIAGSVLDRVVDAMRLQIAALEKKDAALIADLKSNDPRVHAFAVLALAQRKNPAALPGLTLALQGDDPDAVRQALGGLVALGDRRAVPALIDAMRGKTGEFQREILFALGQLGGEDARGYLSTVAAGADDPDLQQAARQALEELSAAGGAGITQHPRRRAR